MSNENTHLAKTLRWTDAFALSMAVSGSIFASFGFALGALGPIGAMLIWVGSAAIGAIQNWIFLEVSAMYPDKPGGIAMIATEGWRRRLPLVGPIASFGYSRPSGSPTRTGAFPWARSISGWPS